MSEYRAAGGARSEIENRKSEIGARSSESEIGNRGRGKGSGSGYALSGSRSFIV